MSHDDAIKVSHGVETLIDRLRAEGVAAGRKRARHLVAEAEDEARRLLAEAREQADAIREQARSEGEHTRRSLEEAIRIAVRDSVLDLKAALATRFADEVQQAVGAEMQKQELLQRLILEVAGRVRDDIGDDEAITILLPADIIGLEALRRDPAALRASPLTELAGFITRDMLRDGVSFAAGDDAGNTTGPGIRIELKEGRIQLDLSDTAVADLLLDHLQPRFRALIEGIVH
jgi:V/A-type H+-transporting ATPase subunit E